LGVIVLPGEIGVLQIEIGPNEKTGHPLFIAPFELEFSVVFLDGFSFIPIEKPEFIQSGVSVEPENNRPEFNIPPDMVRFLLYFGNVEFVFFFSKRHGSEEKDDQSHKGRSKSVHDSSSANPGVIIQIFPLSIWSFETALEKSLPTSLCQREGIVFPPFIKGDGGGFAMDLFS
jgi:hypothetical protein